MIVSNFLVLLEQDKWRNMCIYTAAQGSKDKSRVARARPMAIDALVPSTAQSLPAITSAFENEAINDSPKGPQEGLNAPKYVTHFSFLYYLYA